MTHPDDLLRRYRHIAFEGPIGVGKSTLTRRLAAYLDADTLMEQAGENPYLERFYADAPGYAFQTQVFFLFQRIRQVRELAQPGMFGRSIVSDFMFAKDALFARMNLSDDEYPLYAQMYAQLAPQVPPPDVVVWLQATPELLMQRIRRRAIPMEQRIDAAYLQRLCDGYAEFFAGYDDSPVLVIDTGSFNPVERDTDFQGLLAHLATFDGRRSFLGRTEESRLA